MDDDVREILERKARMDASPEGQAILARHKKASWGRPLGKVLGKALPRVSKTQLVKEIAERLDTAEMERDPYSDSEFCEIWRISYLTYTKWRKKILDQRESENVGTEVDKFMARMYNLAMEGRNAKYAELWARVKGVLKDKSEVKVDLTISADDFVRRNLRAEAELRMEGYGVEKVQEQSQVLPKPLRLDSGQDVPDESPVAAVVAPAESN